MLDARWTKAMQALLTAPLVTGNTTPITRIRIEKKRPNLCFLRVTNATTAAHVCMNIEENKVQTKMWYHIARNELSVLYCSPITVAKLSNSSLSLPSENITLDWNNVFRLFYHFFLLLSSIMLYWLIINLLHNQIPEWWICCDRRLVSGGSSTKQRRHQQMQKRLSFVLFLVIIFGSFLCRWKEKIRSIVIIMFNTFRWRQMWFIAW